MAAALSLTALAATGGAFPLLNGFGGPAGYGTASMPRNDDSSSSAISITPAFPQGINFFNSRFTPARPFYTTVFVNNNGNITFSAAVGTFTPIAFPVAAQPMIAPFWGDVDTGLAPADASQNLTYHHVEAVGATMPGGGTSRGRFIATWHRVGYFSQHNDRINDFQLILTNRSDIVVGDFDVEFRYNLCAWTTGDASGGSGGLGGTPAQAGFDAGDQTNHFTLPGSRTMAVLDLCNTRNAASDNNGQWIFGIRGGGVTVCGNNARETGEECDDGNNDPGDGCSSSCRNELANGATCQNNAQCRSQFCVDGVCCNVACGGQCEACDVTSSLGTCIGVTGAPRGGRTACAGTAPCGGACNGTNRTACVFPGATTACGTAACTGTTFTPRGVCNGSGACDPATASSCAPFVCGTAACRTDCATDADCATGNFCNASMLCVPRAGAGTRCSAATQCTSGNCVDGFCCSTACGGQCEACDIPGQEGTCAAATGNPRGARTACAGTGVCAGACDGTNRTACTFPGATVSCRVASCSTGTATAGASCNGQGACPAPTTTACAPFACDSAACATRCTTNEDCATGNFCSEGVCSPLRANGGACTLDLQCNSNSCIDGVCCNTACDGQCEACNVEGSVGTCTAVTGAPRGNRSACAGEAPCGGTCNGTERMGCTYPNTSTSCREASCTAGSATAAATCDGRGHCPAESITDCDPYVCSGVACATTCTADTDCRGGTRCIMGTCQGPRTNGTGCMRDEECMSGSCAQGVCCNRACNGSCEACDTAGTMGTCTPAAAGSRPNLSGTGPQPPMGCLCDGAGMCVVQAPVDAGTPDSGTPVMPVDSGTPPVMTVDSGVVTMDSGSNENNATFQGSGCACRAAGAPARAGGRSSIVLLLGALGVTLAARRRRSTGGRPGPRAGREE